MSTTVKILLITAALTLVTGVVGLSMWGIPAPTATVKKEYTFEQLTRQNPPKQ